jgi:transposase
VKPKSPAARESDRRRAFVAAQRRVAAEGVVTRVKVIGRRAYGVPTVTASRQRGLLTGG